MTMRNSFLSSEDELLVDAITEPVRYEFQPYLSDDEELPEAPEDLESLQAPDTPDASILDTPEPPEQPITSDVALPRADYGGTRSLSKASTSGLTTQPTNGASNGIIGRVRVVDIEVPLPWLSRTHRAAFQHVRVLGDEATPEAERYPARRSRRLVTKASPRRMGREVL
ncbi:hypothetical protein B0T25DRAFT_534901 [Lasiosphaeria hispida]|uniref:Uncharacterized protein n=1 Tax=Lasiosphaeria hispida TaxID=260671 RepID=A0AAJ0HS02_9PEZI|nr:hypothetical protein B0T25DRAFT_534901 [Lasiosphaeria hispida]